MYKEIIIAFAVARTPDEVAKTVLKNPCDFKDFQLLKTVSVEILRAAAEHAGDYRLGKFYLRQTSQQVKIWFFKGLDELYPGYSKHLYESIENQALHKGNH